MSDEYCAAPDCELPVHRLGYCMAHSQQMHRTGKVGPIAPRLSPAQRLIEQALALADADPLDDEEFERIRRSLLLTAKTYGTEAAVRQHGEKLSRALAAAKARGVRLGRPPKVTLEQIQAVTAEFASRKAAAERLRISERTLYRYQRATDKNADSVSPAQRLPRRRGSR